MFLFNRHRRFRGQLSAYIDGALDPAAARRLEAHLEECARCRMELKQLRSTVAALRELPEAQVPRSFALSPERVAVPRPPMPVTPLAFGARVAAAGVAVALAAVLVVDLGDLGGDGATEEVSAPQMMAEREADDGKVGAEGTAPGEPAPTGMMDESRAYEGEPEAAGGAAPAGEAPEPEGDATTAGEVPEPEDAAPREPTKAPTPSPVPTLPPDAIIVPGEGPSPRGLTPEPEAGIQEAAPPLEGGGGIDALTAAEIGLAAALGVLVAGSLVLAFAGRKR
jgi:hypothetical protein